MWNSVAPGWEASAQFVDEQLALATEALLDAAGIGEGDAVLDLASGPGGAGLCAAGRVGPSGTVVLSDVAAEMVAVAWWERVPKLAGPLAIALAGMDPEVREEIEQRALRAGADAARPEGDRGDQILFAGSVLIGSGLTPRH
jgi:hypothetical protein